MSEEFSRQVLKVVVAKICQPLGVHGMQSSVCETMTDVLKDYILTLARTASTYSSPANRTEPNLSDLSRTFSDLGFDLADLSEFLTEVESAPLTQHKIPCYPVARQSTHVYQGPVSFGEASKRRSRAPSLSSEEEEYDHIPPYLPPLPSHVAADRDKDDDTQSASMEVGGHSSFTDTLKDKLAMPTPVDPHRGLCRSCFVPGGSPQISAKMAIS